MGGNGALRTLGQNGEAKFWSAHTLRTFVGIALFATMTTSAILVVYYTSEARQDSCIAVIQEKTGTHEREVNRVLEKLDRTLTNQQTLISETQTIVTIIHTEQQTMKRDIDRLDSRINRAEDIR